MGIVWTYQGVHQKLQTHLNLLERAVDHRNEHVEEHYHHGNVVDPIQHVANVLDEFMSIINYHRLDLWKPKNSPEQCFEALLEPGPGHTQKNDTS